MISLNLRTLVIAIVVIGIITYLISNNNNKTTEVVINPEETIEPKVQQQMDSFWTSIMVVENENSKVFQYQLPADFNLNPKYLLYHPNFSVSANKMVQIISENDGEATAMLNLWVSLNKGLLDGEENFSKLFETSIKRALTHPAVVHKFKIDINNMVHFEKQEQPENLEYTEDLAINETTLVNPPNEEILEQKNNENKFEPVNAFDKNMALF